MKQFIFGSVTVMGLLLATYANVFAQGTKPAPEIALEAIYHKADGTLPTLSSLKGQIVVLDFWATWCSPCVEAFPKYNKLSKQYQSQGVQFLGITDDPKTKFENFLDKVPVGFWVGMDTDGSTFKDYQVTGRPKLVLINRQGEIVHSGRSINAQLIEEVLATDQVAAQAKPTYPSVMVNGGFAPGEDPMYNGMRKMLKASGVGATAGNPPLIDQLIIRPSLKGASSGYGHRSAPTGHIGITLSNQNLTKVLQEIYGLPTHAQLENLSGHDLMLDVIYWRKHPSLVDKMMEVMVNAQQGKPFDTLGVQQAMDQAFSEAYSEIETRLLDGLGIKVDSVPREVAAQVFSAPKAGKHIVQRTEITAGAEKAYKEVTTFATKLTEMTGKYMVIDRTCEGMYFHAPDWTWEKLDSATESEILRLLHGKGIKVAEEKRNMIIYQIK
jgi:peroxiredoxin